jgi:plasmid stabilization system protein ParE
MLTATFTELANAPMIATACDHIRPNYRRCNVGGYMIGGYMIYFCVTPYGIAIIRTCTTAWKPRVICRTFLA